MPKRFIFRQIYYKDLETFLLDGEIRAKNHPQRQNCHQTSYSDIVERRNSPAFNLPNNLVVNDFVPFYFSPLTSFAYTIHQKNVNLTSPEGVNLGKANSDDRVFIVCKVSTLAQLDQNCLFSDFALNSLAQSPIICADLSQIENIVHWNVFDDNPMQASIQEIGYRGVCKYFQDRASPSSHLNRSHKRMAEFLVQDALPLSVVECIIVKTAKTQSAVEIYMDNSNSNIPIFLKPGCFF